MNEEIKIGDLVKDSQGDIGLVVRFIDDDLSYHCRAVIVGLILIKGHEYLYGKTYYWSLRRLEKLS